MTKYIIISTTIVAAITGGVISYDPFAVTPTSADSEIVAVANSETASKVTEVSVTETENTESKDSTEDLTETDTNEQIEAATNTDQIERADDSQVIENPSSSDQVAKDIDQGVAIDGLYPQGVWQFPADAEYYNSANNVIWDDTSFDYYDEAYGVGGLYGSPLNSELQVYSNEYFPSLDIAYFADWNFSTITSHSAHGDRLLNRNITLSKGGTSLYFTLFPSENIQCNIIGDEMTLLQTLLEPEYHGQGLYRFDLTGGDGDVYTERNYYQDNYCPAQRFFDIETNIPASDDLDEVHVFTYDGKVHYSMYVEVFGAEFLEEADTIMLMSNLNEYLN